MIKNSIIDQLKTDEGFRRHPYKDSVGKWTMGYGWNYDDIGITEEIASIVLEKLTDAAIADCYENFKWFSDMPDRIQEVIVNMCFNMGINRLKTFKKTLAAFEARDFETAAAEMKDSKWYKQVGPRAERLVRIVSGGKIS